MWGEGECVRVRSVRVRCVRVRCVRGEVCEG